jgi:hypothetical protein
MLDLSQARILILGRHQVPKQLEDGHLQQLLYLDLSGNELQSLPESVGQLLQLLTLRLDCCSNLTALPVSIGNLRALQYLSMEDCKQLQQLPDSFGKLAALTLLNLCGCSQLKGLPDTLGQLAALLQLYANKAGLEQLPQSFGQLSALTVLQMHSCYRLTALPDSLGGASCTEGAQHLGLPRPDINSSVNRAAHSPAAPVCWLQPNRRGARSNGAADSIANAQLP